MKTLIVDDEPLARDRLRSLIGELAAGGAAIEVVGEVGDGRAAVAAAAALDPDVVLLDIRMPGMDGLEVARHLARLPSPPAVVFTTAYGDRALEAFEAAAVDYLLKPIRRDRLAAALTRAAALSDAARVSRLAASRSQAGTRTHLAANVKGRLQLIPIDEVRYLHADQKYVSVVWPGGEHLIEESLKSLEEEFPERFLRVHRNTLVAAAGIDALETGDDGDSYLRLRGLNVRLPVSRRLLPEVRRRLRQSP
jgi:two-component system response regulator AlgR